jgi:hypothetical protein
MHPGAAKSDISHSLSGIVIFGILGWIFFCHFLFKNYIFQTRKSLVSGRNQQDRVLGQLLLFAWLCLIGLFLNPYTTTVFLLLPAYSWAVTYENFAARERAAPLLCLAGIVPFVLIFSILGFMYQNFYVFYYLILCAIYGVFELSTLGVVLGSMVVFCRMLQLTTTNRLWSSKN